MLTTAEATAKPTLPAHARTVIATLLVAAFVVILNETIMAVALPRLMVDLGISASTVQWLTSAFLLMTSILTLTPIQRRGVVMGNVSIAISVAPAIGPTLSGLILQFLPWRYLFLLVLPVALASLIIGARTLVNVGEQGHQRLDIVSVLLSIPAFGGIVYGLSKVGINGGGIGLAAVALAIGCVCLLAFGWRQVRLQRDADPLLDLRVFKIGMYSLSLLILCLAMGAMLGAFILLPIYLQSVRGLSSLATGALLLPGGLTMGLLAPAVGKIFDRHGPK